jgi:ribosomal protein S12 methylthiotransferase accessory factor
MAIKDTLAKVEPLAKAIGVTRIADITHLDILRIPNYSAVLPGTEDYIWVYSGKGPTRAHARASALMECIERYSSLPSVSSKDRIVRASYEQMTKKYDKDKVLHIDDLIEPLKFPFSDDMIIDFIDGIDLFTNEQIFVPAGIALSRYDSNVINPFKFSHTNGLASGNVIEEAVCHALCEVIERDAVSLAELRSSALPFHKIMNVIENLSANGYHIKFDQELFVDDPNLFDEVSLENIKFPFARYLINRFKEEGIPLLVKDITSDIGIPTFIATSIQWITDDYGYLAEGHGTHPDARIALVRAITEVSQTRAANIQGARDDLRKMDYKAGSTAENKAWQFMHSNNIKSFDDIHSYENEDILDDIELLLKRLKGVGLDKAIIVNLTDDRLKIPVVRAIVPGLETFKVSKGVIGWRARRYS